MFCKSLLVHSFIYLLLDNIIIILFLIINQSMCTELHQINKISINKIINMYSIIYRIYMFYITYKVYILYGNNNDEHISCL